MQYWHKAKRLGSLSRNFDKAIIKLSAILIANSPNGSGKHLAQYYEDAFFNNTICKGDAIAVIIADFNCYIKLELYS